MHYCKPLPKGCSGNLLVLKQCGQGMVFCSVRTPSGRMNASLHERLGHVRYSARSYLSW